MADGVGIYRLFVVRPLLFTTFELEAAKLPGFVAAWRQLGSEVTPITRANYPRSPAHLNSLAIRFIWLWSVRKSPAMS